MVTNGEINPDAFRVGSNSVWEETKRLDSNPCASSPVSQALMKSPLSSGHQVEYSEGREGTTDSFTKCDVPFTPFAVAEGKYCRTVEMADRFANDDFGDGTVKQNNLWLLSSADDRQRGAACLDQTPAGQTDDTINLGPTNGGSISLAPGIHRHKTFVSIMLLAFAWVMNDVVLAWVHERVPYQSDPLPDIWFSLFPEYQAAIKLTEALLITSLLLALSIMLFHQQRWLVTRRVFFISALCYCGRAFCITLTQVPVPSRRTYCAPRENATSASLVLQRVGGTMSGLGMDTLFRPRELCGDLIYSGHTTILCLCYLTVVRYAPRSVHWLRYVSRAMAFVGVVGILTARKHYTLDVVLAYYITTRIYWIYHTLADNKSTFFAPAALSTGRGSVGDVFWAPVVRYMESDAPPNGNNSGSPFRSLALMVKRLAEQRPKFSWASLSSMFVVHPNKDADVDVKNRGAKNSILSV